MFTRNKIRPAFGAAAMICMAFIQSASADITIVQTNSAHRASAGTLTITGVEVAAGNSLMLIAVAGEGASGNVTGAWSTVSLGTPIIEEMPGIWAKMFALTDLTPGTNDLSVTLANSTGGEAFSVGVLSLVADNGFDPLEAKGTNGSTSLSITFDKEAVRDNIVFGVAAANGNGNPTSTHLDINLLDDYADYPGVSMSCDYEQVRPSDTYFAWTASTASFAVGAVLVKEVVPQTTVIMVR